MQKKIGTILDGQILSEARAYCAKVHIPLSRLLEEALSAFLHKEKQISKPTFSSVDTSFGSIKVSPKVLKTILEEDIYGIE